MASGGNVRNIKVQVRPGKAGASLLIVVPLLFLAFGAVLFASVIGGAGEARPAIILFAGVWCTTMLMLFAYGVYALMNRSSAAGMEIDITRQDVPGP